MKNALYKAVIVALTMVLMLTFSGCWSSKIDGDMEAEQINILTGYCQKLLNDNEFKAEMYIYEGTSSYSIEYDVSGDVFNQSAASVKSGVLYTTQIDFDGETYSVYNGLKKYTATADNIDSILTTSEVTRYNAYNFVYAVSPKCGHSQMYMRSGLSKNKYKLILTEDYLSGNYITNSNLPEYELNDFYGNIVYEVEDGAITKIELYINAYFVNLGVITQRTVVFSLTSER
ncbi:MAG: hypothetical protein PHX51_06055 [Clostridia bacterium]|nr:hypothetical protein [Clostridia bacterium]